MSKTSTVASTTVLRLGYKVQSDWATHTSLFAGFKNTKDEYDTVLAAASSARERTRIARERRKAELANAKAIAAEQIAKAKAELARTRTALDAEVASASEVEKAAVTELSRLANGARYFAKYSALSDESVDNDAAARAI